MVANEDLKRSQSKPIGMMEKEKGEITTIASDKGY